MTNRETASRLWEEAVRIGRRDREGAVRDADWNLAVRRAQEVVELALKAALRLWGFDYPKHHDVGPLFQDAAIQKGIALPGETLDSIRKASYLLAQQRGSAFYMEKDFTEKEARQASQMAEHALDSLRPFFAP